jgi:peptide/nickel transport system ATP-binding protein/oligopeptide transport system ATP-binding protein
VINHSQSGYLLEIRDLRVEYVSESRSQTALDGVSLHIDRGEAVGILGESGCGKTTLALSVLRLLPSPARILKGSVVFRGRELLHSSERQMQGIRGGAIAMIFQEPKLALNPVMRAVDQVAEVLRAHGHATRKERRQEARRSMGELGLDTPEMLSAYPHQLSGGQQQRLLIAQALAARPALLVADEPTASIDALLRLQILCLLNELRQRSGLSLLFITHDPADLAGLADRILILHKGRVVEQGSFAQVSTQPLHPYTRMLLRSVPPALGAPRNKSRYLPELTANTGLPVTGCRFADRCPDRQPACIRKEPPEIEIESGRAVRCFQYGG